ncbi:MAG: ABC transporter ATP-binding protein [Candidatus Omnitrophica bacterium]|nr:ABC transporter ATP-binding protein [Candidatus Omnitrophota bacterium]
MNEDVLLKVDRVSKKYCKSLKQSMLYGMTDIGRNMFRLSSNPGELRKNEFWAVNDVSFELKRGETLGLIGSNGSGKTSLLKMLNGIFWPDKGEITIKGRVGALIAVGAGFHPVLTGRENIYVNGAILGMNKRELDKKFDAIVDFADIGDFLDTPVKYYSSGMFVRLGFAVAVHCNPDILLVDEVLAVGDMAFQAKCLDRMMQYIEEGGSVIFVSHQLHQVDKLCRRSLLMYHGDSLFDGETEKAVDYYRKSLYSKEVGPKGRVGSGEIIVKDVQILNSSGKVSDGCCVGDDLTIRVHYETRGLTDEVVLDVALYSIDGGIVCSMRTDADKFSLNKLNSKGFIDLRIKSLNLLPNIYVYSVNFLKKNGYAIFDSHSKEYKLVVYGGEKVKGVCSLMHEWVVN